MNGRFCWSNARRGRETERNIAELNGSSCHKNCEFFCRTELEDRRILRNETNKCIRRKSFSMAAASLIKSTLCIPFVSIFGQDIRRMNRH